MRSPSILKIKRRKTGNSGAPSSLQNGELAFNEIDKNLYYGMGADENDDATSIICIAGDHTNVLKDSYYIHNPQTNPHPTDSYLVIKVNGVEKAIRLYDL
jgi:hypothetical protein